MYAMSFLELELTKCYAIIELLCYEVIKNDVTQHKSIDRRK